MKTSIVILLFISCVLGISFSLMEFSYKQIFIMAGVLTALWFITRKWWIIMIALVSCILFFLRTEFVELHNVSALTGSETAVTGVISDGPYRDGDLVQFQVLLTGREKLPVHVRISDVSDLNHIDSASPGKVCVLKGSLQKPLPATNFYAFDYSEYLKTNASFWRFEVKSPAHIFCYNYSKSPVLVLKRWRHYGLQHIEEHFPDPLKGISGALLFGERHNLHPDTEKAYQRLGLIHLLAVSGLHVGLVAGSIYYVFIRAGCTHEKTESIILFLLPVYVIMAGAAPSVIRAASMMGLLLLIRKRRINICPFRLLLFFALFILFLQPYYTLHVGFQLSFIVSGSLILSLSLMKRFNGVLLPFVITVIAQLSSIPILLFHFYEFSLLSFGLNLLFIPIITLIVLPSVFFLFFISIFFPVISGYVMKPVNMMLKKAHQFLDISLTWKGFQYVSGKPEFLFFVIFICSVFWFFYCLEQKGIKGVVISTIIIMTVGCLPIVKPYIDGRGYVTIIDVGQGDSILIELPYRKAVYLIDGGGAVHFPKERWAQRKKQYDPGAQIIIPYLKARGIRTIDKLIVTHGDADHYGGLYQVAEDMHIREVLYGKGKTYKEEEVRLLKTLRSNNIPVRSIGEGSYWQEGESRFYTIWPQGTEEPGNHRSIVIWAKLGGAEWLFMGDLEEEGEQELIQQYPGLKADFLKAGHHGSRTSTTVPFVKKISPKVAFISAGRCNRFGHPHDETLQTLGNHEVKVFRTDFHGGIRISFQKEQILSIETVLEHPPDCE